jgi:hypothetical protein
MQKFHKGDHVKIADDLGPTMRHFTAGVEAIVMGSYRDQYGGRNTKSYTLHLKGAGETSWYEEYQLTLIESGREDLLKQWETARDAEIATKADRDWIFEHGDEVVKSPCGASLATLGQDLGCNNLWGANGEGITYYQNSLIVWTAAKPFLETKDKDGWLKYCAEFLASSANQSGE